MRLGGAGVGVTHVAIAVRRAQQLRFGIEQACRGLAVCLHPGDGPLELGYVGAHRGRELRIRGPRLDGAQLGLRRSEVSRVAEHLPAQDAGLQLRAWRRLRGEHLVGQGTGLGQAAAQVGDFRPQEANLDRAG